MMKKEIVFGALLLLSTNSNAELLICNKYSCQDSNSYNPTDVLDAFGQVLSGGQKELVFCEADSKTKSCLDRPIMFPGRTNWVDVQFQIPFVRILQAKSENDMLQLLMDYQVQTNRYYPVCELADSTLSFSISNQGDYLLNSGAFNCQITELGETTLSMKFSIDYMDLDKGYIGATYQSFVKGDVLGGGSGYVLMQISEQREIELPRPVPNSVGYSEEYDVSNAIQKPVYTPSQHPRYPNEEPKLVDWDWDNIKTKWDDFKTKFLKVLYLEPLDD